MKPKIIAIYWAFNPNVKVLRLSLRNLIDDVDEIIIVDNGSRNIKELKELATEFIPSKVNIVELRRNLGVKALNIGITIAIKKGADWVLLMDDDSIYPKDILRNIMLAYNVLCKHKNDLCDKITVISLPYWKFNQLRETFVIFKNQHIFSGSLIKVDNIKKYNLYINESFFVDMADVELYERIHKLGMLTIYYTRGQLIHHLGRHIYLPRLLKPWVRREWSIYTPWRYYMILRNLIILVIKYRMLRLIRDVFLSMILFGIPLIIVYGFKSWFKAFTLGIAHGLFRKLGYLDPALLNSRER